MCNATGCPVAERVAYPLTDHRKFDILHLATLAGGDRMQFDQLRRREFITLLGGTAAAWPLTALAQQPTKLPTIGFIGSDSPGQYTDRLRAFRLGLKSTGFTEGQNVGSYIAGPRVATTDCRN